MGFFDKLNTGIARERIPYFPRLKNNVGGRLTLSRMVFGYSTMIPPLYTCAFYNAVANDGRFVRPRLVKSLRSKPISARCSRKRLVLFSYFGIAILTIPMLEEYSKKRSMGSDAGEWVSEVL